MQISKMKRGLRLFSLIMERQKLYLTFVLCYILLLGSWCLAEGKRRFRRSYHTREPRSILVIQLMKIGDMVCTTPVFRELRSRFPNAKITVMALPLIAGILEHNPHVDAIVRYDAPTIEGKLSTLYAFLDSLKSENFDWSVNLSPNFRNISYTCLALIPNRICLRTPYCSNMTKSMYWAHSGILEYNSKTSATKAYLDLLRFIGITAYSFDKDVYINSNDTEEVRTFFKRHHIREDDCVVALHPFAGVRMKEWGKKKFIQLAEHIIERYHAKILVIGSAADRADADRMQGEAACSLINTCGEFRLSQLPALLAECRAFISVDTGPLYIADALRIPVINIAGPCSLQTQSPDGIFRIVQKPLECLPCSFIMNAPRICRRGDRKCLDMISVDDVLSALSEFVSDRERSTRVELRSRKDASSR